MSTETTTETQVEAPVEQEAQETAPQFEQLPDDHPLVKTLAKVRAELKETKASAAALTEKASKWDEAEDANRSELEKAQARVAELEKQTADATAKALRATIAAETGVPAGLLTGNSEDEMRATAAELLKFRGEVPKGPSSDGQGRVGEAVTSGVKQLTHADMARMTPEQIVEAQDAGQFNDLLGIK